MTGGAWIKMRGGLTEHPRVIAIARHLMTNHDFREWLLPGGGSAMNGQLVSDGALRCVTTSALLRVWSQAREHGTFEGDDLVLHHSELLDLDQMGGVPGLGEAMESVGWAIARNGVTLPGFKEYNVPKTGAERQAEHRNRRSEASRERNAPRVTSPLPEESREERDNNTTRATAPEAPVPANGHAHPKPIRVQDPEAAAIAEGLARHMARWDPEYSPARLKRVTSSASVEEIRRLIQVDQRKAQDVRDVIVWLFGSEPGDYAGTDSFDWRTVIQGGKSLRKSWDQIARLFRAAVVED